MTFDPSTDKWRNLCDARLSRKWERSESSCKFCGKPMRFNAHETNRDYINRGGSMCLPRLAVLAHIIHPDNGGPPHHDANLTVMCSVCRDMKGRQNPDEWIANKVKYGDVTEQLARWFSAHKIRKARKEAEKRIWDGTLDT